MSSLHAGWFVRDDRGRLAAVIESRPVGGGFRVYCIDAHRWVAA